MKVNILGTDYEVLKINYEDARIFKEKGIDGYCDSISKDIAVCRMATYPNYEQETAEYCSLVEKEVLRHEIVHAFLNESGLKESSGVITNIGWSQNEEMVDWIALQFPKMLKAFKDTNCL